MTLSDSIRKLLEDVRAGAVQPEEALKFLRSLPFTELGFAKVDHHRELRHGFAEVILCQGKTPEQVVSITKSLLEVNEGNLLLTRATRAIFEALRSIDERFIFHETARAITLERAKKTPFGLVSVVCAGTADLPVAEEARVTAEVMGSRVENFYDVGVAGVHRLLAFADRLLESNAIVVLAGMEGALPSVVGGLVECPVIGVPTSAGYGASLGGLAALLTMVNSCASNVSVVNIDNGFGAGYIAAIINRMVAKASGEIYSDGHNSVF